MRHLFGSMLLMAAGCDSAPSTAGQHFYVVNTEGESLTVIDHGARAVVETIALAARPHGQAPRSAGDRIFVTTDGGKGEVIAIDTRSRSILWRLSVGNLLNEPHLTADERYLFAPDLLAARTHVVDVESGAIDGSIAMLDGDAPLIGLHNTYLSHRGAHMYVTAIQSRRIAQIDVASREITRLFALSGEPRPAAITEDDRTMYVQLSDLHGFVALDLETGDEVARVEWPDPGTRPPGYEDLTIPTKCHGIALSPDGTSLWAATNLEGHVHVYSVPALEELVVIEVGNFPNWFAFTGDGSFAYVTNTDVAAPHGSVSVIDTASKRVVDTLDVGPAPKRIHRVAVP